MGSGEQNQVLHQGNSGELAKEWVEIRDPTPGFEHNVTHIEKEYIVSDTSAGAKFDGGKIGVWMLPTHPLEDIARVLDFGAQKYAAYNWTNGISYSRIYASLLRHLFAWWRGEDIDPESGLSHLSHAGCNVLFLLQFARSRKSFDDRPVKHYEPE